MIAYNVTIKIDKEIEKEWLEWMKNEYIPGILATGLFNEYKFYHLLDHDENDTITYIIQHFAPTFENYETYTEKFLAQSKKNAREKWNDKFISFHTVMEIVN